MKAIKAKSWTLNCECVMKKKCDKLVIYDFGKDLVEVNVYKGKKLLGGVVVKRTDVLTPIKKRRK